MKEKIINSILNLIKVKSIATFVILFILVYLVINSQVEVATVVSIVMLVLNNLFDKDKVKKEDGDSDDNNIQTN